MKQNFPTNIQVKYDGLKLGAWTDGKLCAIREWEHPYGEPGAEKNYKLFVEVQSWLVASLGTNR